MRLNVKMRVFGFLLLAMPAVVPQFVHAAESGAPEGGDEETDFGGSDDDTVIDDSCEAFAKSVGEEINRLQKTMSGNYFELSQVIQNLISLLTTRCPGWEPVYPKPIPVPVFRPDWARPLDGDYIRQPLPVSPIPPRIYLPNPDLCPNDFVNVPADLTLSPSQISALQGALTAGLISLATYEQIALRSGGRLTGSVAALLISLGILPASSCESDSAFPYDRSGDLI